MKKNSYKSLALTIEAMEPDRLDKNTIESLRNMLNMKAFAPIITTIENKIIEIGNYLKSKETPKPVPAVEVYMGQVARAVYPSEEEVMEEWQKLSKEFEASLEYDVKLPPLTPKPQDKE